MFKLFISFLFIFVSSITVQARGAKIKLSADVKSELKSVLNATVEMHDAYVSQNEVQIADKTRKVLTHLSVAKNITASSSNQHHLNKMLTTVEEYLELIQVQNGKKRQATLSDAFKQLVQIAKVYKVDRYKVFFCSKDKSWWIQKGWKPQNPIHPEKFKSCGKLVDRT